MKRKLTKKIIRFMPVIASLFLSLSGNAVTTLGQEEDTFSKIWSHPSQPLQSKMPDIKTQEENSSALRKKDQVFPLKKSLSVEQTLDLLHHKDLKGSRLH